jgi:hypothetical protein
VKNSACMVVPLEHERNASPRLTPGTIPALIPNPATLAYWPNNDPVEIAANCGAADAHLPLHDWPSANVRLRPPELLVMPSAVATSSGSGR